MCVRARESASVAEGVCGWVGVHVGEREVRGGKDGGEGGVIG